MLCLKTKATGKIQLRIIIMLLWILGMPTSQIQENTLISHCYRICKLNKTLCKYLKSAATSCRGLAKEKTLQTIQSSKLLLRKGFFPQIFHLYPETQSKVLLQLNATHLHSSITLPPTPRSGHQPFLLFHGRKIRSSLAEMLHWGAVFVGTHCAQDGPWLLAHTSHYSNRPPSTVPCIPCTPK